MAGLSVILRGTTDDRLNWAFNLYDLNRMAVLPEVRATEEAGSGGYLFMGTDTGPLVGECDPHVHHQQGLRSAPGPRPSS